MKRRVFATYLAALLLALTLSACGGSAGGSNSAAAGGDMAPSASESGSDYSDFRYGFDAELPTPIEDVEAPEGDAVGETESRLDHAKIIYTANVEAETTAFDSCAAGLEALVKQAGGYLEYASTENYGSGYRSGSYTIRVPARYFESFLESVGEIGHVVYQDKSGENISEQYYDTESRLATQRTKMERLQALLAKAENMEDIITIESAIAETELSIEQLTGSLRHYDALVDYATIYVNLREVLRLSSVETEPPGFGSQMASAFSDGLMGFGDFLQGVALFLAYSWIWLLILALIAFAVTRRLRRARRETERFGRPGIGKQEFFHRNKGGAGKNPDDKQPKD